MNDITTYILTHLRNTKYNTMQGHTTLLIYDRERWKRFKSILSMEDVTASKFLWSVVDMVVDQFDGESPQKTLFDFDKERQMPNIDSDVMKVIMPYLLPLDKEELNGYAIKFHQCFVYANSFAQMTMKEREVSQYSPDYLWKKYSYYSGIVFRD